MRILILGDIHGNLPAIELVLVREKDNFDMIISHGDVVNYGPWTNECVDLLDSLNNTILLAGNHEAYFISGSYNGTDSVAKAFFEFNFRDFKRRDKITKYKHQYLVGDFCIKHTLNNKYIFQDTNINIDRNYIIGHSHQQFIRNIDGFILINTGSVGQNRRYINIINYIVFDTDSKNIQLKYLTYDHSVIINEFKKRNYPEICINYYSNKEILIL